MACPEREERELHSGLDRVTPGDDTAQTNRYSCVSVIDYLHCSL